MICNQEVHWATQWRKFLGGQYCTKNTRKEFACFINLIYRTLVSISVLTFGLLTTEQPQNHHSTPMHQNIHTPRHQNTKTNKKLKQLELETLIFVELPVETKRGTSLHSFCTRRKFHLQVVNRDSASVQVANGGMVQGIWHHMI